MLALTHGTHLGIVKFKQRAREGLSGGNSLAWNEHSNRRQSKRLYHVPQLCACTAETGCPMLPSPVSSLPWAMAASDIFAFEGHHYLVLVDYYSKYIEVIKLNDLTSQDTIEALKEHFSRHGIPEKLVTDCGVQYTSKEFETFARSYNFEHVLVSPKYPCANGEAEAAVKKVKSQWRKKNDKNKALLEYRATPIQGINLSPSQLSMGRRLRTTLPIACGLLEPEAHNIKEIRARMKYGKEKLKYYHDRRGTKELPRLSLVIFFRVKPEIGSKEWKAATVVQQHTSPRSYIVDVGGRRIRRNRVALRTDSSKSHAGYQSCHANIEKAETDPEKPRVVPHAVPPPMPDTRMEKLALDYQSVARKSSARKIPPSPEVAATRGLTLYTTRCGRQVKKPVKLDL